MTITDSRIFGYGAGGVLFDGGRGKDGETATINAPQGLKQVGYVAGTTIEGSGGTSTVAQSGVVYNAGAGGSVTSSSIAGNASTTGKSVGILLSKASGEGAGVKVSGSYIGANKGYGLWNGDAGLTTPWTSAVDASGNYWGTNGTPAEAETVLGPPDVEGVSGSGSVMFAPVAGSKPTVAAVPASLPDAAPVGSIVDPVGGEAVESGETAEPVVFAEDDYGVKSVTLTANGAPVETITSAPYVFTWTPSSGEIGTSVHLEATITDSSGQTKTSDVTVPVLTGRGEIIAKEGAEAIAKEAAEKDAATKAGEAALSEAQKEAKEAKEKAEAAEKSLAEAGAPKVGKAVKDTKKGTVRLSIKVPRPGPLVISGPGIKKVKANPTGPGEIQILIKAKGKALTTLKEKGKVTVEVTIKLSGPNGPDETTTKVTLVKK